MKILRTIAAELGKGLLAGLVGTAAMTVVSTLEMKARKRAASATPAKAAERVLGMKPQDERARSRLSNLVHFTYGTLWGTMRSILGRTLSAAGVRNPLAPAAAHLAVVWGTELVALPRLGLTPPVREWGRKEVAIDWMHHLVYAAAVDGAYRAISRL
jgi:hypothetical protein